MKRTMMSAGVKAVSVLFLLLATAVLLDAQPVAAHPKLAYVLLLDVDKSLDQAFDPTRADATLKRLKADVEAMFPGTVVFFVRPLADSATACKNIDGAQDCDRVIVKQTWYRAGSDDKRVATSVRWMKGANRHPNVAEDRPGDPPLRCQRPVATTLAVTCRDLHRAKITEYLRQHFTAAETAHSTK